MRVRAAMLAVILASLAVATLLVPEALGRASTIRTSPAAGESVGRLLLVNAAYSEALDPERSLLELVDPTGAQVRTGAASDPVANPTEMWITDLPPELTPGVYTVNSTAVSLTDGTAERSSWQFTILPPAPATPERPALCTDLCGTSRLDQVPATDDTMVASPTAAPGGAEGAALAAGPVLLVAL
ncbi:MAG TPA: copper resistance protein CopC, partial [Candidatus Limnocylindrales bacterium]|nr:copper resistance protein CopC [Candidatus Limnocylindrales bacterium]